VGGDGPDEIFGRATHFAGELQGVAGTSPAADYVPSQGADLAGKQTAGHGCHGSIEFVFGACPAGGRQAGQRD